MQHSLYIYTLCTALALAMTSCYEKETVIDNPEEAERITLFFRNETSKPTLALDENLENQIDMIDLLAFESFSTNNFFAYRRSVDKNDIITDASDPTLKRFSITVPKDKKTYRFVLIANARTEINTLFAQSEHIGDAREELFSKLISETKELWNTTSPNFKRIPMHGESGPPKTVEAMNNHTIQLYRSIAAVNITIAPTAKFELKDVYIFNRPTNGRIVPDTNNFDHKANRYSKPSLPLNTSTADAIADNTIPTPVISSTAAIPSLKHAIYLYETPKHHGDDFLKAPCIVLGGNIPGRTDKRFYRVDFLNDHIDYQPPDENDPEPPSGGNGSGGPVGAGKVFYPLLRNHRYEITIAGAADSGSYTPLAAAKSQYSQLRTEFTEWNSQDNSIYIDDIPYELYISRISINLKESNPGQIALRTTFPGKWTAGNATAQWFKYSIAGNAQNAWATIMLDSSNPPDEPAFFTIKLTNGTKDVVSRIIKVEYK